MEQARSQGFQQKVNYNFGLNLTAAGLFDLQLFAWLSMHKQSNNERVESMIELHFPA